MSSSSSHLAIVSCSCSVTPWPSFSSKSSSARNSSAISKMLTRLFIGALIYIPSLISVVTRQILSYVACGPSPGAFLLSLRGLARRFLACGLGLHVFVQRDQQSIDVLVSPHACLL